MAQIGSLHVATEVTVDAPRSRLWQAVLAVGEWWPHRFRPGSDVALEPWVGGRFLEDWGDEGGGALYGQVTEIAPGDRISVSGPMGLQGAVSSRWTLTLADDGGSTVVRLDHSVIGDVDEQTSAAYTSGWDEVLAALAAAASSDAHGSLRGRARF